MQELIKSKDLAVMLSMGTREAAAFCRAHGVMPIDVCTSEAHAKKCLRWRVSSVIQMMDTIEAKDKPAPDDTIPRSRSHVSILGDDVDTVIAKLGLPVQ